MSLSCQPWVKIVSLWGPYRSFATKNLKIYRSRLDAYLQALAIRRFHQTGEKPAGD
jgi:hypothetical protein